MPVRRTLPASASDAFDLLVDLRRHDALFPATHVQGPVGEIRVGSRFSAITAGIVRDRMILRRLERPDPCAGAGAGADTEAQDSPGVAVLEKVGPIFAGFATITVRPITATTCEATWSYDVSLAVGPPWASRRAMSLICSGLAWLALRQAGRALSA